MTKAARAKSNTNSEVAVKIGDRPRPTDDAAIATTRVPKGKIPVLIALLEHPGGTTITEMMAATGWQAHSVRGAIAGAIKKSRGLSVISEQAETGRIYRIASEPQA